MKKKLFKKLVLVAILSFSTIAFAQVPRDFNFDTDHEGFLFSSGLSYTVESGLLKVTADGSKTNAQLRKNAVDVGASGELSRVAILIKNGTNATKLQLRKSATIIVDDITISAGDTEQQYYVIDVPAGNTDWLGSLQLRLQFIAPDGAMITGTLEVDRIQVADPAVLGLNSNLLEGVSVYPNPASNNLKIQTLEGGEISLFNILGARVLSETTTSNNHSIDVSRFPKGVYLLKIRSENKTKTTRVILK